MDGRKLHAAQHAVETAIELAALLTVDLHEPDAAARTVDVDVDVRAARAGRRQTATELAAVARVRSEYATHVERLGALVGVVRHVEREVLGALVVVAALAGAPAAT